MKQELLEKIKQVLNNRFGPKTAEYREMYKEMRSVIEMEVEIFNRNKSEHIKIQPIEKKDRPGVEGYGHILVVKDEHGNDWFTVSRHEYALIFNDCIYK